MGVREPAADGDCVLWVEDVGCGGVVDDDGLAEISANLGKVLGWSQYCGSARQDRYNSNLDVIALENC